MSEWVSIVGYGSLLSVASARRTCPSLRNFRRAHVDGYCRVFTLVSVSMLRKGLTQLESREVASVAAAKRSSLDAAATAASPISMLVSVFEIPRSELAAYCEREQRYEFVTVDAHFDSEGASASVPSAARTVRGLMCIESTDEAYLRNRCGGDERVLRSRIGDQVADLKVWRSDVLPASRYLRFCLQAAKDVAGDAGVDNFLHTTFLADRRTSIFDYIKINNLTDLLPMM